MSAGDELKKVIGIDAYGKPKINTAVANYFWAEGAKTVCRSWRPKAKIPQLETLIEVFNGTDIAIAGGSVLGSYAAVEYGDIDIFPLTKESVPQAIQLLEDLGSKNFDDQEHSKQSLVTDLQKVVTIKLY